MILLDPHAQNPRDRGKKPLDRGWTEKRYTYTELLAWALQGGLHNLGVRLDSSDLVIDVDPRNGGEDSWIKIQKEIGNSFNNYPVVRTGGGGLHIYTKLSAPNRYANELHNYPGVEWKSVGRQVVAAGSKHPETGNIYTWEHRPASVPAAPQPLVEWLHSEQPAIVENSSVEPGEADLTPDQLAAMLAQLPAEDYRSNDSWFALMAAAYHATAGAGVDEFVLWSTSDPSYADQGDLIRKRWHSLARPGHGARSAGTLVRELQLRGAELPHVLRGPQLHDHVATLHDAQQMIENLDKLSTADVVRTAVQSLTALDPLDQIDAIEQIRESTGKPKTALKQILQRELNAQSDKRHRDVSEEVAQQVLATEFESGRTLAFALDGRYWRYNGTHWEPYSTDQLKGTIKTYAQQFRTHNPGVKFQLSAAILASEVVLRASTAKGADLLGMTKAPDPVVNCENWELWLDEGRVRKQKHQPESLLTHCLPIVYDPGATCDCFDGTLSGIFSPLPDCNDVIRHLWEVFGYTIQPNKWIPAWFLFQGRGANGKSLVLDTLIALLGPAARPVASISELSTSRSEFALSECVGALAVIDDDVRKDTVLNDDILKKLSEDKPIRARFLRQNKFTFRNCSTTFLAANSWPKTRDLSDGMLRRAYGFPFRRQFKQDDARKRTILDQELPGVLNSALAGLERLRKRGYFVVPASCKQLIDMWTINSNQLLGYLHECHDGGRWSGERDLGALWDGYVNWASKNGIRRAYSRPGFIEGLLAYGLKKSGDEITGRQ